MTGDNFVTSDDFQPAFWSSEWKYEPQRAFGAIDAPDIFPVGGMWRYDFTDNSGAMPVQIVAPRGWA